MIIVNEFVIGTAIDKSTKLISKLTLTVCVVMMSVDPSLVEQNH